MKTHPRLSRTDGSALLVVIMFVGILTLVLGSYLSLTSNQNQSAVRSRLWNSALPVAEAGIEEGLSQIYNNAGNYSADGWSNPSTNLFTKTRYLGNDHYTVNISGTPAGGLTITSTGFVQAVTFVDNGKYYDVHSGSVSRVVQVKAKNSSFPTPVGMVAKTLMDFTGNVSVDSYDSSNPASSSTNASAVAMYDATKRDAQAFVACTGSAALALGGNQHVYGYAASGVGALTPTAKGSALIGDLSWVKGVQSGHASNNFAMTLPDVQAPFSSAAAPFIPTNKIYGNSYDLALGSGNYLASSVPKLASIYVSNSSVLYIPDDCSLSLVVLGPGAKLDVYIGGSGMPFPTVKTQITNGVPSTSSAVNPANIRWLGLNNCTWTGFAGGSMVGVIYAPHMALYASGNAAVYGAITVDTFEIAGTFDFHNDISLRKLPSSSALVILSWAEQ
jgi:hypothetical protein